MTITPLTHLNLHHQRVLIREDFNVPMQDKHITSDTRIRSALPTIQYALQKEAAVIVMSHLGRPQSVNNSHEFSLAPVADRLQTLLNKPVKFIRHWIDGVDVKPGQVALCENVRFEKGEKENDPSLAKKMASLCDVFIMDAFATAHRAEASTVGVAQFAPQVCGGFLLMQELKMLNTVLENPERPLAAIVGGSKISTKLSVLHNLITQVNALIVGGGIANVFLLAQGFAIGNSLCEIDLLEEAKTLLALAERKKVAILLPSDVVVAKTCSAESVACTKNIHVIESDDMILDIGPESAQRYAALLKSAGTVLWNGPVGVFELPAFEQGTRALALAVAESAAFSVAGGGDTLAAIEKYQVADRLSYISTGGGAFLEYIEGKELPAIKILRARSSSAL